MGSFRFFRQMRATSAVLGVVLLVLCLGAFAQQKKTLVIVDDLSVETTHSMFFKSLKDREYSLTFRRASDSNIQLFFEEEFLYDSLIIFASNADSWNDQEIGLKTVLEFVDSGAGNVLIAGDVRLNHFVTAFADECGVDFASSGSSVIDHLSYDQSDYDGYHTLIAADNFVNSAVLFTSQVTKRDGSPIPSGNEQFATELVRW